MFDILLTIAVGLFLFPLIISVIRGKPDMFEPAMIFSTGFSASYFLKAYLISTDPELYVTYPEKYVHDEQLMVEMLVLSIGSLAMFFVGYYSSQRMYFSRSKRAWIFGTKAGNGVRIMSLFGVAAAFGSMAFMLYIVWPLLGSLESLALFMRLRDVMMDSWEEYPLAFHFPVYVGFFSLLAIHAEQTSLNRTPGQKGMLSASTLLWNVAPAILALSVLGSRAILQSYLLALVFYRHYFVRRIGISNQISILVISTLMVAYLGILQKQDYHIGQVAADLPFPENYIYRLSNSYEQFETLMLTVCAEPEPLFGLTVMEDVIYTYIPRAIWNDKPMEFGFIRAQNYVFPDYSEISRASTYPIGLLGELYLNFSYIGPLIGMLFLGWALGIIYNGAKNIHTPLVPIFCFLLANSLAPQRTFGTLILMTLLLMLVPIIMMGVFKIVSEFLNIAKYSPKQRIVPLVSG